MEPAFGKIKLAAEKNSNAPRPGTAETPEILSTPLFTPQFRILQIGAMSFLEENNIVIFNPKPFKKPFSLTCIP